MLAGSPVVLGGHRKPVDQPLYDIVAMGRSCGQIATIGVYEVPDPSRCGIVQVDDDGVVRDFVEKPRAPVGNLAFSGLMLATPDL